MTADMGRPRPTGTETSGTPGRVAGGPARVEADEVDVVACPRCRAPASLERGLWLESTDGPVEHGRLRCAAGCGWFLAPVELLVPADP
ncbi:MAG: hypothetical protein FWJ70_03600 [Micromonosporaceae bacterium]|jgi:uncharacterized protein YbaR (Trm112 family)